MFDLFSSLQEKNHEIVGGNANFATDLFNRETLVGRVDKILHYDCGFGSVRDARCIEEIPVCPQMSGSSRC